MHEKRLREIGQKHLIEILKRRPDKKIEDDLKEIDFTLIASLLRGERLFQHTDGVLKPAPVIPFLYRETDEADLMKAHGERLISDGKVAVLMVAGGQGSRLGIPGPKGVVEVSPIKKKSLFCIHAEKIAALEKQYSAKIPFFIMTSRANDEESRGFFKKHHYFGLDPERVHFFVQGMLPSVTKEGKFIFTRQGGLFMNPDGHGGVINALKKSGAINTMKAQGIEEIFYFQVDNPLVKMCDPLFLGLHHAKNAQMSSKVIRKRDFEEKVGVIVLLDGKTTIVEYSDMSRQDKYATDDSGNMLYWAGSIAIHVLQFDFIKRLAGGDLCLPFHKATKKIAAADHNGLPIEIQGIKFETFIFDALPMAERSVTIEVRREEEFAPVKNREGEDSLESALEMQDSLYRSWLKKAGKQIKPGAKVEISPSFALDEEQVVSKASQIPEKIETDFYLE